MQIWLHNKHFNSFYELKNYFFETFYVNISVIHVR